MRKEIVLAVSGLSFVLFVYLLSLLLADKFQVSSCGCPKLVSYNFVYIFVALAVIFVGSLIYYLYASRTETQIRVMQKNLSLLLSFLDKDERRMLSEISKSNGEMLQSSLSERFGKLKAHRLVKRLEEKGIVTVESSGKTNKVSLKPELLKEMKR